jgi:hypothetical protein
MKQADTLCGQNAEFWYAKAGGIYSDHRALSGLLVKLYAMKTCGEVEV